MTDSVSFTFNNGTITCDNKTLNVSKGDTVNFSITNSSTSNLENYSIRDWGIYFNNPFCADSEKRYSFGAGTPGSKTVMTDTNTQLVPKYNSYITYVETNDGQLYTLDPAVVVSGGDTVN
ncbi:MAG: hypothetical protein KUG78_19110 [Kangiellaceae bacterium]|nr:hypothetical protein [Kangiellaceae bacterium]